MEQQELKNELLKAAPVAGVSGASFLGVSFADWVYAATFVYIVLQCVSLGVKIWMNFKKHKQQ